MAVYATDSQDMFSRANCINNESFTYSAIDPPAWRLTFSTHADTTNGNAWHYVASGPLAYCDINTCWYYYEFVSRSAAIHVGEGGLPGTSTKWLVYGDHRHWLAGIGYTQYLTTADDCNLEYHQVL